MYSEDSETKLPLAYELYQQLGNSSRPKKDIISKLTRLAQKADPEALLVLGLNKEKEGNHDEAYTYFEESAQADNSIAKAKFGHSYLQPHWYAFRRKLNIERYWEATLWLRRALFEFKENPFIKVESIIDDLKKIILELKDQKYHSYIRYQNIKSQTDFDEYCTHLRYIVIIILYEYYHSKKSPDADDYLSQIIEDFPTEYTVFFHRLRALHGWSEEIITVNDFFEGFTPEQIEKFIYLLLHMTTNCIDRLTQTKRLSLLKALGSMEHNDAYCILGKFYSYRQDFAQSVFWYSKKNGSPAGDHIIACMQKNYPEVQQDKDALAYYLHQEYILFEDEQGNKKRNNPYLMSLQKIATPNPAPKVLSKENIEEQFYAQLRLLEICHVSQIDASVKKPKLDKLCQRMQEILAQEPKSPALQFLFDGHCALYGWNNVPQNTIRAIEHFQKAADLGIIRAYICKANCYNQLQEKEIANPRKFAEYFFENINALQKAHECAALFPDKLAK